MSARFVSPGELTTTVVRDIAKHYFSIEFRDQDGDRVGLRVIDNADAPAMALAVLEAADLGQSPVAELLRGSIRKQGRA